MTMIEKVKTASLNEMEEVLNVYVREGYNIDKLLDEFNMFSKEKRQILIKRFFNGKHYKFLEVLTKTDDKVFMVDYLVNKNLIMYAFEFLSGICDPKSFVKSDNINKILNVITTDAIIENFGTYFKDEILELKDDYYKLLSKKDELSDDDIRKVYIKSFAMEFEEYKSFHYHYLSYKEKFKHTKIFLSENCSNYYLAKMYLDKGDFYDEDFGKLLLNIGCFAPADVIYDVLIRHERMFNESQKLMLEKSLYDTRDIEYIAYYTFYKNKKEFNRLFKSAILFLGFVRLNEELFKNTEILNDVVNEIKEKEVKYTDSGVVNKIDTSYQIKPKNGVKPNE